MCGGIKFGGCCWAEVVEAAAVDDDDGLTSEAGRWRWNLLGIPLANPTSYQENGGLSLNFVLLLLPTAFSNEIADLLHSQPRKKAAASKTASLPKYTMQWSAGKKEDEKIIKIKDCDTTLRNFPRLPWNLLIAQV
jgi:hypothetical protein